MKFRIYYTMHAEGFMDVDSESVESAKDFVRAFPSHILAMEADTYNVEVGEEEKEPDTQRS